MLTQLLDVFSFISVLFRGTGLALQTLVAGGVIFTFWIVKPLSRRARLRYDPMLRVVRRLILASAIAFAIVQICYVAADSVLLTGTTGMKWTDVTGAGFFVCGVIGVLAAGAIVACVTRRHWIRIPTLIMASLVMLATLVGTSHAAGRMQGRSVLLALGAVHLLAVSAWIGGLPYLLLALPRAKDARVRRWICRRFSKLATFSVIGLGAAGLLLSIAYIDSPQAVYGTSYGAMVVAKTILFAVLLLLGLLNALLVRRLESVGEKGLVKLRRFAEAEVGIGFTIVLAAASLTSQPPAVDMTADRVPSSEIVQRLTPRWPSLRTPPVEALSPATPFAVDTDSEEGSAVQSYVPGTSYRPNTPDDIAWSEYNHHWAGIIVLAVGLLALASRAPTFGWARHWPLAFLGLAVFLFLRADPENWPLGPRSFWQSFAVAEVLQHRIFVALIVLFAFFEWGVSTGRIANRRAALVFPAVCAAGGALLLTHAHPLGNIKEELLSELSHIPLAILGVVAGWSRWLEWRIADTSRRGFSWIWPVCFVLIGAILLNYRES